MDKTELSKKLKLIVESKPFNYLVVIVIIISAILVGLSTDPSINTVWHPTIILLENLILVFFCIEIIMRIGTEANNPLEFFKDGWNLFDFIIVVACFIPFKDKAIYVLRLLRVVRTFRLFRAFPKLKPVLQGMVNSLSSVMYVALLLTMLIYIYAVIGISFFATVDPEHFSTIWKALFTLFQILTLENWNTIMLSANSVYPVGGPLYFVSFIIIGTMIIMNLVLGIIIGNMSKAVQKLDSPEAMKGYLDEDAEREKQISTRLGTIEKKLNALLKKKK